MKCPICDKPTQKTDSECPHCGALLSQWKTMRNSGETLRQRGLACVYSKDYVGALLAFLESALTNPLDEKAYLDVARMLFYLEQRETAERFLSIIASARPGCKEGADQLRQVIASLPSTARPAAPKAPAAAKPPAPPPAPKPAPPVATPEPPKSQPQPQPDPTPAKRRALLAMGECVQTYRKSPKKFRNPPSDAWRMILQKETMNDMDWTGTPDPVVGVMHRFRKELNGAFDYVLGLGFWQQGEDDAARTSFTRCVEQLPPTVSPYGYLICLSLNDPDQLHKLLGTLEGKDHFYGRDPLDEYLVELEKHLRSWENPGLADALHSARARRTRR